MYKCIAYKKMKTCYLTKESAEVAAAIDSTKKIKLYVYECKVCKMWHRTKQKQAKTD